MEKVLEHKIYESELVVTIFRALGITDPRNYDPEKLRYHRVIIMTDADVDGAHIATLLMTFFFRCIRPIVENGHLYIATPPLYRAIKGNNSEYCWTDMQVRQFIDKYGAGEEKNVRVQRFKGLGEIDPEEFADFIGPEMRLDRVHLRKEDTVNKLLEFYMGKNTMERQEFIIDNLVIEDEEDITLH